MKISDHVSYSEVTNSATAKRLGLKNEPNTEQLNNIISLCKNVFEPLRNHFKVSIGISSLFRSNRLNRSIGGAASSQHLANNGAAMDIDADMYGKITNNEIFTYIKDNLTFDQLIAEGVEDGHISWVHVSYKETDNRNQILIMYREGGKSKYLPYTEENFKKYIK